MLATLITVGSTSPQRYCSWESPITIGGNTWQSGKVLEVDPARIEPGSPDAGLTLGLSVAENADLVRYAVDQGPVDITVGWARSTDDGNTWTALKRTVRGKLGISQIASGELSLELETLQQDVDTSGTVMWSHEQQLREFPGDLGFEYARPLGAGDIEIGWPK